jgi:hypothetical protein
MSPDAYEQFVVAAQRARRERAAAARSARARRADGHRVRRVRAHVGFRLVEVGLRLALAPARAPDRAR